MSIPPFVEAGPGEENSEMHFGISRRLLLGAGLSAALASAPGPAPAAARPPSPDPAAGLDFSYVAGADGVPLSVAQAGDKTLPGMLFLHGLGQSHLSFARQLHGALAERFHLVAFDLRGHGNSGKPWEEGAYANGRLWADDVHNIIAATGLVRPLIVAWSYGTLVIADYIRQYGTGGLSGIVMIGALGGLVSSASSTRDPKVVATLRELHEMSGNAGLENTLKASRAVVPFLTARPIPRAWTLTCETVNAMVPPFARTPMTARMAPDNSDLIARIDAPMMLMAGSEDRGTPEALMQTLAGTLPHGAAISVYAGCGHSPFAEDPDRFNKELAAFATKLPVGPSAG